ncbi:MAG TPA: DUF3231 family protein [Bacillus sp. (in: firmicutes)]|uniref:DUF3231 family protein n=1 Tax=Bacillus litorisediminis TaxID=2922713 RepID=UPI001FAD1B3A|nr:DUF3231 family protein [Bacillus litorisediminis]HWO77421.1 DUF3231 family protein [Bacillus sp. (in: firmicutes)]
MNDLMKDGETSHNVRLTAPEIANLWTQYQNDSMSICIFKYMLKIVEDLSIRPILELALSLAEGHITKGREFFTKEKFPVPHGFTEEDVNLEAPRLFSDEFCLTYTYIASVHGLAGYAAALGTNMRRDIRDYFVHCQNETMQLFNQSLDLLLEKGTVSRPPFINPPDNYEFVETKSFMQGILGGKRTLNCIEISNIFWDLKKAQLDRALCLGFAQVAKLQEVKDFLWRGVKLGSKHIEILESLLALEHLPSPKSEDAEVTNSTISPFSDRLIMYHKLVLGSTQAGVYGTAIATSQRNDLGVHFSRLLMEFTDLLKEGFNIMVKHKWVEQVPLADDREKLSGQR